MSESLVKVTNVSKKFCRDLKQSLWYGMKDLGNEFFGRSKEGKGQLRKDEFWAVKDISFELKRGECLGLIGRNGAGKTTLLRMLNGLIKPDVGRIEMHGRVGALIALGAGFNPILTGRENVYVNAAVLGLGKDEIDSKFDEIVEFAELEEFIDTPVQNYSSGMQVRLGFAISTALDPDILLLDEVLAVGDVGFRAKCFNIINRLIEKTAVIFVSHSMPNISRICTGILLMNHSKSIYQGKEVSKGIGHYYSYSAIPENKIAGSGKAELNSVKLMSNGLSVDRCVEYQKELSIIIDCTIDEQIERPSISIVFINQELQNIAQCSSYLNNKVIKNNGQRLLISLSICKINFNPGVYSVEITITAENHGEVLLKRENIKQFQVVGQHVGFAPIQISGEWKISDFSSLEVERKRSI